MKSTIFPRTINILFLSAICVIASATTSSHKSSKNTKRQYDGIDVSHHQGQIDWKEVAKDKQIKFVYIKATQGTSIKDKNYEQNIKAARRQGLRCGSYHYLSCLTSVRSQFRNFQKAMRGHKQDLIPMIDIEHDGVRRWSKKQVQDSVVLFAKLIERKYGKKPLIYGSSDISSDTAVMQCIKSQSKVFLVPKSIHISFHNLYLVINTFNFSR